VDARSAIGASRRTRRPLSVLLPLSLALLLAGCSAATATPAPAATPPLIPIAATPSVAPGPTPGPTQAATFPLTLTDDEGTSVTIPALPTKIVTLTPAATETLFELGVGDRVVGKVQDISLYPPQAASVPDVASFPNPPDVEKIVSLGTDLVIAGGDNFTPPDTIQKLRSLGVPVLVLFAPDVKTALADMGLLGQAVGRPAEAASLAADIQTTFDQVAAATAALPKPRVFYELDATNGYFGPAPDYFGTQMIRIAGGDPLTSGTSGVYQIEAEKILAFDPQVILLGDAAYGVTVDQVDQRPGWNTLTAVRNGDIRPIDDVIVTRPGPRLADGIRALAIAIHPDLVLPAPVR
jgi:iron complex transport system substrate-binding protein